MAINKSGVCLLAHMNCAGNCCSEVGLVEVSVELEDVTGFYVPEGTKDIKIVVLDVPKDWEEVRDKNRSWDIKTAVCPQCYKLGNLP